MKRSMYEVISSADEDLFPKGYKIEPYDLHVWMTDKSVPLGMVLKAPDGKVVQIKSGRGGLYILKEVQND